MRMFLVGFVLAASCGGDGAGGDGGVADGRPTDDAVETTGSGLMLQEVASGFTKPVQVVSAPGDDTHLFVVEHAGVIRTIEGTSVLTTAFLDIDADVCCGDPGGEERGLEGLAFHPDFASNRKLYVDYVDNNKDTQIVEYQANAADPPVAEPSSKRIVLTIAQPDEPNHKGGDLQFSPRDGYLYIAVGDGGGGCDQHGAVGNGQNINTLLGKILRIDPLGAGDGDHTSPTTNPFYAPIAGLDEIWVYGVRNPWRMSFDAQTGDLFIGDVGQDSREEVDVIPDGTGGQNLGWRNYEGTECSGCPGATCPSDGVTMPVFDYGRAVGTTIIGGFVYRGSALPALQGHYFFADNGLAFVRSFSYDRDTGQIANLRRWPALTVTGITSFGVDQAGELYLASAGTNRVYKIVAMP